MIQSGTNMQGVNGAEPDWSFAAVEAALVDAVRTSWRLGGGRNPFATDGPWGQYVRSREDAYAIHEELDAKGEAIARRCAATRDDVVRMEVAMGWLVWVPSDHNRKILGLGIVQLATGRKQICWRKVRRAMRIERGRGCEGRYVRAIKAICANLNAPDACAMIREGAGPKAVSEACAMPFVEAQRLFGLINA